MADNLCAYYGTDKLSEAVQHCIKDALLKHALHTQNKRHWSPEQTLKSVEQEKTPKDQRVSVYLPNQVMEFLRSYYCKEAYITDAVTIRCCVYDVLNNAVTSWKLQASDTVFYMLGQKNAQMQEFLNECFNEIRSVYKIDGYAEPFTGTANVLLHTSKYEEECINDNSHDLINLLRVIRDYPYELKLALMNLSVNTAIFNYFKAMLRKSFSFKASKSDLIQRAVAFYFCRFVTHYGDGMSYKEVSPITYMRKLDIIYGLSQRLQETKIKKRDAIYSSKVLMKEAKKFLIYFDAPYICSEEHYRRNNAKHQAFSAHTALRNRVQELRSRHVCVLSYRITASKSMQQKGISSEMLQQKLDSLYLGRGFFYKLRQFNSGKGQIEILLATVPFAGSQPYTLPLAEMGVK